MSARLSARLSARPFFHAGTDMLIPKQVALCVSQMKTRAFSIWLYLEFIASFNRHYCIVAPFALFESIFCGIGVVPLICLVQGGCDRILLLPPVFLTALRAPLKIDRTAFAPGFIDAFSAPMICLNDTFTASRASKQLPFLLDLRP